MIRIRLPKRISRAGLVAPTRSTVPALRRCVSSMVKPAARTSGSRSPGGQVLDLSPHALDLARQRLGTRAAGARWLAQDVRTWRPDRRFDLWHDRAVFHFPTDPADRDAYRSVLHDALAPDGYVVVGTFAVDGPTHCSGLPVSRYSPDSLAAQFADLDVVEARRVEHVTPGDTIQPFTWLLLRRPG